MSSSSFSDQKELGKFLKQQVEYVHDINKWAYEVLHFEPDTWQQQGFKDLVDKHFVAWSTGTGVGKSAALSIAILHHLVTHPFPKIPCTAPTQHQLFDILWAELSKWMRRSELLMKSLKWTQTKVALKGHEEEWFAIARTSRPKPGEISAEGLQGFHSENLFFVVDEASAVPDPIFDAVDGAFTTKGARAALAGNPTRKSGYFYKTITDPVIGEIWAKLNVDARFAKHVEPISIHRLATIYGVESDTYRIKVLGLPPTADYSSLFADIQLVECHRRILKEEELGKDSDYTIMSCDPARFGADYTIIYIRRGNRLLERIQIKGMDTYLIAKKLFALYQHYHPKYIMIDVIGIGAGVVDTLTHTMTDAEEDKNRVVAVNVAEKPEEMHEEMHNRRRDEMFWHLHERIDSISIPFETMWLDEELPKIKYTYTSSKSLIKVMDKDDIKKELGGRSPGDADALALCFYNEVCALPLVVSPSFFRLGLRETTKSGEEKTLKQPIAVIGAQRYSEFGSTRGQSFE